MKYKTPIVITVSVIGLILLLLFALSIYRSRQEREKEQQSSTVMEDSLSPGEYTFNINVEGNEREYILYIPKSYDKSESNPLILAFHGAMGSADIMAKYYGFIPKAEKEGFIVAFPNGASRLPSGDLATWNAGNCCAYAVQSDSDDVTFVKAVIDNIKKKVNVGKIFATGMSNGGMFSHRLACDMSDTFTAIAAVSGTINYDDCNPKEPISIMHIHGLLDDRVLFNGGCGPKCTRESETEYTSVPDTISGWVKRNNCKGNPERVFENEGAYCDVYSNCTGDTQVKLCVVKEGGHSWPGGKESSNQLEQDIPSNSISATDEVWDFFNSVK